MTARPTNNIVNTNSFYDVVFLTAISGPIKFIQVTFPAGTTIPSGAFFNEAEGIGPGTASKSGQTITYTVTNAVNVPAGTKIRLEFANINNPLNPSANYKVTVTTRDASNTIIDGPTQSTAYTMKQIGKNAIADGHITTPKIADFSITSTKPNEGFVKRVTLLDDVGGHDKGWNPNGGATVFTISEPNAILHESFVTISVTTALGDNLGARCFATPGKQSFFQIQCENSAQEGSELHYVITRLPSHVSD